MEVVLNLETIYKNMSITIKELAEYLNVSIGTVSRALNDDPKIAAATREKVKNLAQKLEYVPSNLGRGLQAKKSFLLGYLVSNMKDSFYNEILQGIAHEAHQQGYGLLLGLTEENARSEQEQLHLFQEKSVDGIIVSNYSRETIPYLLRLKEKKVPLVICDFDSFDAQVPVIVIDEIKAMEMLAEYLISLGHKKMGFYYHLNENSLKRYQIISEYLHRKNLPKPILFSGNLHFREVMSQTDRPTAIIGYSDLFAVEAIHTLKELKITVPDQASVTGFDDLLYARWPEYDLTTIYQPKTRIGELAASLLIDIINGKTVAMPSFIEPQLIVRQSCRELKK